MATTSQALTPKQQAFVREYLIDLNAAAAYRRAGYKAKNDNVAAANASALIRNHNVARAIAEAQQQRAVRTLSTADEVIEEHKRIAFSDIGDVLDFSGEQVVLRPANKIPLAARRAISSIKVRRHVERQNDEECTVEVIEYKFWDKHASLTKLAQHLGMDDDDQDDADELRINVINVFCAEQQQQQQEHLSGAQEPRRIDVEERRG